MSKIKLIIIAAVAAVIGYCGTTYYMGNYAPQTEIKKEKKEIQPPKPAAIKEEIRG